MVTHAKHDYAMHAYIRTIDATDKIVHDHDPSKACHLHVQKEIHYV